MIEERLIHEFSLCGICVCVCVSRAHIPAQAHIKSEYIDSFMNWMSAIALKFSDKKKSA